MSGAAWRRAPLRLRLSYKTKIRPPHSNPVKGATSGPLHCGKRPPRTPFARSFYSAFFPLLPGKLWGINRGMPANEPIWSVYIVRTVDDRLYSGVSTDASRRYREHLAGGSRAAKYLKAHKPRALDLVVPIGTRSLAQKVEYHLKRLPRNHKEALILRQALTFDPESGRISL